MQLNPTSKIELRLGLNDNGAFQQFAVSTIERHMAKYIPKESGHLSETTVTDNDSITYISPYAHYQYVGEKYVDPVTKKGAFYNEDYGFWSRPNVKKIPSGERLNQKSIAGDGSYWDKRMMSAEGKDIIKELQNYINRR